MKLRKYLDDERLNAINALAIRVFAAGLAFIMQMLLARWLGLEEFGIYAFVWTGVIIFAGMAELGFSVSIQRFLPGYEAKKDFARARGFLQFSYLAGGFASFIIAAIGAAGVYLFSEHIRDSYLGPLYLAFICFPLYTLTDINDGTARARGWINLALMPTYIVRPFGILALTALAYYSGYATTAETVMVAAIIATWLTGIIQLFVLYRRLSKAFSGIKPTYNRLEWLKVSIPILMADGIYVLFTNVDVMLVGSFLGADSTGLYFAGVKVAALLSLIPFAVGAAWGPRYSALWSQGDQKGLERMTLEVVHGTFWPTLFGALMLMLLGGFILRLFGAEFEAAYSVLVILLIGLLIRSSTGAMDRILALTGQQNRVAVVLGLTLILNIILNISLIPFYGVEGAALATSISLAVQAIGIYVISKKYLGVSPFVFFLLSGLVSGLKKAIEDRTDGKKD